MSEVGSVGEWVEEARRKEPGEDTCIPRFYNRAVPDKKRSEIEGRACFNNIPYVEVFIPGDKLNRPNRKVIDDDKTRWANAWGKFQRGIEITEEGTPLEVWAFLNPGRVAELKALAIFNIEGIAAVDDGHLEKLGPGGRKLRERARQFLKPQKETETELRKQNAELGEEVTALKAQFERLQSQIEARQRATPDQMSQADVERHINS